MTPLSPIRAAAAVLAIAVAVAHPAPAVAQAEPSALTWGVVPANADGPDGRTVFDYTLDPGAELVDHVAVSNHSTEEITVTVYASDAFTTADGGFDLLPAAESPTEVGSWVTLERRELAIPARSRVHVPFQLAVPPDATPGDHAGGVVASVMTAGTDAAGEQVQVEHRVGARIYLRVTGEVQPQLTVERLDAGYAGTWNPFAGGDLTATYRIRNTGNVRLTGEPTLLVAGWFGLSHRSVAAQPLPQILPGDTFIATVHTGGVPPLVRLHATVELRPSAVDGDRLDTSVPLAQSRTTVWAMPWGQLALLLLVAGAVTGWWWRRQRRQRLVAAQLAAAREAGRSEALNPAAAAGGAKS